MDYHEHLSENICASDRWPENLDDWRNESFWHLCENSMFITFFPWLFMTKEALFWGHSQKTRKNWAIKCSLTWFDSICLWNKMCEVQVWSSRKWKYSMQIFCLQAREMPTLQRIIKLIIGQLYHQHGRMTDSLKWDIMDDIDTAL